MHERGKKVISDPRSRDVLGLGKHTRSLGSSARPRRGECGGQRLGGAPSECSGIFFSGLYECKVHFRLGDFLFPR